MSMKTKNIVSFNREACLSLSSQVHCGKIQCKHGCPPFALWEKTENNEATKLSQIGWKT